MVQFSRYIYILFLLLPFSFLPAQTDQSLDALFNTLAAYDYGGDSASLASLAEYVREHLNSKKDIAELEARFVKILESKASPASKQFVTRQLSLIGTGKSVPVLLAMLASEESADDALYALQRMPGPEVDKVLLKELKRSDDRQIRLGVINALGNRQTRSASSELGKIARQSDSEVAMAAISALGKTGGADAEKTLTKLLKETSGEKKTAAADALLVMADAIIAQGDANKAGDLYQRVFSDEMAGTSRYSALRGLVVAGHSMAAKNVLSALTNYDWGMAGTAVHMVTAIPGPDFTRAACEALPNTTPLTRSALILAIADRGDHSALPYLKKELKNSDENVREAALEALSRLPDTASVDLLVEHAIASSGDEQEVARKSLDRMQGEGIDDKIAAGIRERDGRERLELIRSAGARRIGAAKGTLFELAGNEDGRTRVAAISALPNVSSAEDLPRLIDILLQSATDTERQQALQSAATVALKEPDQTKQAKVILDAIPRAEDPKTRGLLLQVLGRIGNENGLPVLKNALDDENADIRVAAIKALGEWPDRAPSQDLLAIAKTSKDRLDRVLALRSYIKLAGIRYNRQDDEALTMYQNAMQIADDVNEKRLALSGVSTLPALGSLQLAGDYLTDPELKGEAEVAVIELTDTSVAWRFPQESLAMLDKVVKSTESDLTRTNAQERIDNIKSR